MYRALTSFSGVISMAEGEVREISDLTLVKDLIKAGYIEEVKADEKIEATKRRKKTNES